MVYELRLLAIMHLLFMDAMYLAYHFGFIAPGPQARSFWLRKHDCSLSSGGEAAGVRQQELLQRAHSVLTFDGATPETINCRLTMLGFVWAVVVERMTGQTVFEHVTNAGQPVLLYFLGAVQLFTYASSVPIMSGESMDARSFGPFMARAERWNGHIAMLGFLGLVITQAFVHSAVFGM